MNSNQSIQVEGCRSCYLLYSGEDIVFCRIEPTASIMHDDIRDPKFIPDECPLHQSPITISIKKD